MTKLLKTYRIILPLILIVPLVLVACGSEGDSSEALPTRVVVGGDDDVTAEVTEAVVDVPTEDPAPTEEPEVTASADDTTTDPTPTQETEENAPPPPPPPPGGGPTDNTNQQSTSDEVTPVGPPGSTDGQPTNNAAPPGVQSNAMTEFSSLEVGTSVLISGTVSIFGDGEEAIPLITDANGMSIEMQAPTSMAEAFLDSIVEVFGEIVEASGDTDAGIAIVPSAFSGSDTVAGPGGLPANDTGNSDDNNAPPFLSQTEGQVLDFTVEVGATALQTYDSVVESLDDALEGLIWTRLSGSSTNGWTIDFFNPDAFTVQSYVVDAEGVVTATAPSPAPPISDPETDQIDRDLVVVDSDYVEEQLGNGEETPFGAPIVILATTPDGGIAWTILGPEQIAIDATTDPE